MSLTFYIQAYYVFFLLVLVNLLGGFLAPLAHIWVGATLAALPVALLLALANLGEAQTFRGVIALSSAINILLVLLAAVLA